MAMTLEESRTGDGELIGLARDGDRTAFAALVERHYDFVFRVAFRLSGNRADAEDVAQEVCVRLGRAIRSYRGDGAITTWLYTLVLNAVRDMGRKTSREKAKTQAWAAEATIGDDDPPTDDPVEAMWEAVRLLPDKQRDAITLVYGEGLSHADAAEAMALAESTVSWHVHEGKKRLKLLMRQAEDE